MLRTDIILMIVPFLQSAVPNVVGFGVITAVMGIRKDGVTAWSQLEYSDKETTRCEKVFFATAFLLWLLPAIPVFLPYYRH